MGEWRSHACCHAFQNSRRPSSLRPVLHPSDPMFAVMQVPVLALAELCVETACRSDDQVQSQELSVMLLARLVFLHVG